MCSFDTHFRGRLARSSMMRARRSGGPNRPLKNRTRAANGLLAPELRCEILNKSNHFASGFASCSDTKILIFACTSVFQRTAKPWLSAFALLLTVGSPWPNDAGATFTAFESGPVRPLAISTDGSRLFVANTPDNRLDILAIDKGTLSPEASVPVGLEPVALAVRGDEVWVVNHLSDSVSIVDIGNEPPRVTNTLWLGDEPRDIVFAGPNKSRAFITAAHRGQNVPFDPAFTTPSVGRADVWVFDAENPGVRTGGTALTILSLFGDTPRALTVSPDGTTVYAAVHRSGNQTTVLNEEIVCDRDPDRPEIEPRCSIDGSPMPGGLPGPYKTIDGLARPEVGMILKYNRDYDTWEDSVGRDWSAAVRFDLPDYDVFAIDATANPPVEMGRYPHVGTVLFNMATNPVNGDVYVSNTEARNEVRFEGPGTTTTSVRGRLHEARITILSGQDVAPRHLNPHIDYTIVPSPSGVAERSLATPLDIVVSADGDTLFVAAFGSAAIGVIDTSELAANTRQPNLDDRINLSGGGPCGLVLDEDNNRLYVVTRFDNTVSAIDLATRRETQRVALHNPEPATIVEGRRFLYDAELGSSNGEASCASCHVFADVDHLAWDLGNPDGRIVQLSRFTRFHPMKGPMTVQTLRGLDGHGSMHWRGERNGALEPGGNAQDERAAFRLFNSAFVDLLGREAELDEDEMETFADFVLRIIPPPNPVRRLDNTLNAEEDAGRMLYHSTFVTCSGCHTLNPAAGRFGTNGVQTISLETQEFKTPQLRNMYERVGMFGGPPLPMFGGRGLDTSHQGQQIRGFGYLHDGSLDTLFRFLSANIFGLGEREKRQIESFLLAFDANLAPAVGQQVSIGPESDPAAIARLNLLNQRANAGECDLVAHAVLNGEQRGWHYDREQRLFESDREGEAVLRSQIVLETQVTFTCTPPGSGFRIGVDRDADGIRDRDEIDDGSDPADASSPSPICTGDCNGDGRIGISELIAAVRIALAQAPIGSCASIDNDGDNRVAISEIISAVRSALQGCG